MKRTTRYVLKGINESVGEPRSTFRVPLPRKRTRKSVNESIGMLNTRKTGSPLFEAVKSDTIVTVENIDSVIRKIKKLTGCKVCLKGDNLVCCEGEKVIVRRVLNGKRTVDAVVELVKAYLEKADANECRREIKESVAERFAAYRHLYESEEEEDTTPAGDEETPGEEPEAEEHKEEEQKDKEEDEDVPMTAVVLTVKKGDGAKLKDELIDAGIPEDDVDVIEGEEDDEDDKVKVDANSIFKLKDFLKEKKDIDLEEKLGGEIIDDEAEPEEEKEGEKDGEDDKKEDDALDFGDADFDALFGADDDSADAE